MKVRSTIRQPYFLAHLALVHGLHTNGLLADELITLLQGTDHHIAMTFVDDNPVAVALLTTYSQLMVYCAPEHRRNGYTRRAARLLQRDSGLSLKEMDGCPGHEPTLSQGFFESLGVNYQE